MTYGELRTYFLFLLNRNDCTETQADMFISWGIKRTERKLKAAFQKGTETTTVDGSWPGYHPIPGDLKGLIEIRVNDVPLNRLTSAQALQQEGFIVKGPNYEFTPDLTEGDVIEVDYYSAFLRTTDPMTNNNNLDDIPDVLTYASLVFAADAFVDDRKAEFNQAFEALLAEVQAETDEQAFAGGSYIQPYGAGII